MKKLDSIEFVFDAYIRGRDYIVEEKVNENLNLGLVLLTDYIERQWDVIEIMMEDSDER